MNDVAHLLAAQAPPAPDDLKFSGRKGNANGLSLFEEAMKARIKAEELQNQNEKAHAEDHIPEKSQSKAHGSKNVVSDHRKMDQLEKKAGEPDRKQIDEGKKDPVETEAQVAVQANPVSQQALGEKTGQAEEADQPGKPVLVSAAGGQVKSQAVEHQKLDDFAARVTAEFVADLAGEAEGTVEGTAIGKQQPGIESKPLQDLITQEKGQKQELAKVDLKEILDPAQTTKVNPAIESNPAEVNSTTAPQNATSSTVKAAGSDAFLKQVQSVQVETSKPPTTDVKPKSASPTLNGSAAVISSYRSEKEINLSQALEPARMAEAQSTEVINQISGALEALVKARQNTLRLQLNPEDLGRIDLRMTTSQNGLTVVLSADQAATGKMLEGELAKLKQSLENAGIQLAQLSIGQHGAKGQMFESHSSLRGNAGRSKPGKGISAGNEKVETVISKPISGRTLIDYQA